MNASHKGRRGEHRARALLEAAGFTVVRAAASKGPVDLVAFDAVSFRLVSVKSGTKYPSAAEKETLALLPRPANASVEVWRFADRCRHPVIERL
jgi:Holliday junction resolvase